MLSMSPKRTSDLQIVFFTTDQRPVEGDDLVGLVGQQPNHFG